MSKSEHQDEHDETFEDEIEEHGEENPSEPLESDEDPHGADPEEPGEDAVAATEEAEAEVEEFIYEEVGVDDDHRVAQLRKLKYQFGDEMVLTNQSLSMEDSGPALIVCPNCNSEEIRGQKFCTKCNARLPQLPLVEQKYNPGSIDGAARKYVDSINKFHSGDSTLEEFMEFLHDGLDKVRAHVENLADLSADGVMSEWLPQASILLSDATQLWHDSVEGMLERCDQAFADFEDEEAEYEELSEEELAEREPPMLPEDRIRSLDFTTELESIFRANDQMLEYLRIVDSRKSEATAGGMQF